MSISGSLQDVSVAEVMQFIHLGGRTGTLVVDSPLGHAEVGFHRGRIISAVGPQSKRLGDLLMDKRLLVEFDRDAALERQASEKPRRSFGRVLLAMGLVSEDEIRMVVSEQIETTVYDLVSWSQGSFEFNLDELRPVDDIGVYPGDILPDINLNTQMVVLEALRIFDEKNREKLSVRDGAGAGGEEPADGAAKPAEEPADALWEEDAEEDLDGLDEAEIDDTLKILLRETEQETADLTWTFEGAETAAGGLPAPVRLQVVTDDAGWAEELEGALSESFPAPARLGLRDAGLTLPGEPAPVVVADLRAAGVDLERLGAFTRARKRAAVIAVVGDPSQAGAAYQAGALAALPPDAGAVAACVQSVVRSRSVQNGIPSLAATGSALAKLKRVVADLRSGLLSATVALNLMNVISESVERAIMFLVRGEQLVALGAFGFSSAGEPLASAARGVRLRLRDDSTLATAVNEGQARSARFEEVGLSEELAELLGPPRTGQVVVFPVLGSEKVIAVIYSDNGGLAREIEEIEIVELAAAQVGVAFENEMLRRKMARRRDSGVAEGAP